VRTSIFNSEVKTPKELGNEDGVEVIYIFEFKVCLVPSFRLVGTIIIRVFNL